MKLTYNVISDKGLCRDNNEDMALVADSLVRDSEDSFSFQIPENGMKFCAVVCDGVGGRSGGEIASEMACDLFRTFVDGLPSGLDDNDVIQALKSWAKETNFEIMRKSGGNGMATTLTGLLIYFDHCYILNIGDSRTYRLRYGTLKQMTVDHSERDRTGDMSVSSSIIYNCLGIPECFIDITPTRIVGGDAFVICSDGLCDMIPDDMIAANAADAGAMLDAALEAGGRDNVTVITLNFE